MVAVCGEHQQAQLQTQKGETDLLLQDGQFYLATCCEMHEPEMQYKNYALPLGVDLGVAQIATDSDGNVYSGSKVKNVRFRHRKLRSALQKAGTKSAKRHLRKLSGKEARFARDTNHVISKATRGSDAPGLLLVRRNNEIAIRHPQRRKVTPGNGASAALTSILSVIE